MARIPSGIVERVDPPFLFLLVLSVYLSCPTVLSTPDSVLSTILVFNILENSTVYSDAFVHAIYSSHIDKFPFVMLPNGHWSAIHPTGTALITSPIYCLFWVFLRIIGVSPIDGTPVGEWYRFFCEHIAAALLGAGAVSLFFIAVKRIVSAKTALLATLIYAFASSQWTVASQNLWTHSSTAFLLCLSLELQTRLKHRASPMLLVFIGVVLGQLVTARVTNGAFALAFLISTLQLTDRKYYPIVFLGGLIGLAPMVIWNWFIFGTLLGGHGLYAEQLFTLLPNDILANGYNLLFHPYRGLFFFAPFLFFPLIAIRPIFRIFDENVRIILIPQLVASVVLFASYSANKYWYGGFAYGPRYLTDTIPSLLFLTAGFLELLARGGKTVCFRDCIIETGFTVAVLWSLGLQIIGAYHIPFFTWDDRPFFRGSLDYVPDNLPPLTTPLMQ